MERYAAAVGCRHAHLVRYFGQRYQGDRCGACDYCLGELESIEQPVETARKILSCVARVGQRFGAAHVTNVLCGSDAAQVSARGHDRLSTFGLLRDLPSAEVRGYIEQLTAEGLLRQTGDEFPVLALTEDGVSLLKDARRASGPRARAAAPPGQGSGADAVACGRRRLGWRGSRPLRPPAARSSRYRAWPRRSALRDLPRHDAARAGADSNRRPSRAWQASTGSAREKPNQSVRRSSTRSGDMWMGECQSPVAGDQ